MKCGKLRVAVAGTVGVPLHLRYVREIYIQIIKSEVTQSQFNPII